MEGRTTIHLVVPLKVSRITKPKSVLAVTLVVLPITVAAPDLMTPGSAAGFFFPSVL